MKKLIYFLIPILFAASCTDPEVVIKDAVPIPLKAGMEKKIQQDNQFSLDLFKKTIAANDVNNVFISPLSVSVALGMAWNGADKLTKTEMESALNMSGLTDDQINEYYKIMLEALPQVDTSTKLNIANSIWYKLGFPVYESFLQVNKNYFNAEIHGLDFNKPSAVDTINDWCARKTNDLIKKPLDRISADAVLYLINAIYFKGIWSQQFDKKKTFETNFTTEKGTTNKVDMMQLKDTFGYAEDETAQYLDLPYGNKAFSMTVILPKEGKTTSDVLNQLSTKKWSEMITDLHNQEIQIYLPKFKVENKFELKEPLQAMGMNAAFTPLANFSKISEFDLMISRIIHSTYCEVNEEGTEAAAVTIIEFETTAMPMNPVFNADHPFIFIIREKSTGVILFTGKMGSIVKS
jgi:serpin B